MTEGAFIYPTSAHLHLLPMLLLGISSSVKDSVQLFSTAKREHKSECGTDRAAAVKSTDRLTETEKEEGGHTHSLYTHSQKSKFY